MMSRKYSKAEITQGTERYGRVTGMMMMSHNALVDTYRKANRKKKARA